MRFHERVVLVTGAARGIGRGCAEHFVREGASVVLADVDADAGRETADALAAAAVSPGAVQFVHCDVSDHASVQQAVDLAVSTRGRLDVCVANAAIVHGADFLEVEEVDFDRVLVSISRAFPDRAGRRARHGPVRHSPRTRPRS